MKPKQPQSVTFDTLDPHDASFVAVVESYIRYYALGSSHTARAKQLDLCHFSDFLASFCGYATPEKLRISDWSFSAVQRFVEDSLQRGESPATVARRLATLKHMGRVLAERIAGFTNPAREVKPPLIKPPTPHGLSAKQIEHLEITAKSRVTQKNNFARLRNATLAALLIDTGLRAEEVRLLKLSQITEELDWIKNVRTKGKRYRNVYISSAMRDKLANYLEAREQELKRFYPKLGRTVSQNHPLFISVYGCKPGEQESFFMGAKTIWRAINELSSEVHLHPHKLRHSYALELLNSSHDIRLVSQALGHSDVRTTMRYTERSERDIAAALEQCRKQRKKG